MQQICQLKSFNKSIRQHRKNTKSMANRTEGESMQYKNIYIYIYIWYKHQSSGTWFPIPSLLTIREIVQSVHL